MSTLAKRVKEARGERWKPAQLAALIGLSRSAVSQIEDGTTKSISLTTAFKLQDHTGFSARYIALGEGPKRAQPRPEDSISTEVLELAKKILTLDAAERKLLLKIFAENAGDEKLTAEWHNPETEPKPRKQRASGGARSRAT